MTHLGFGAKIQTVRAGGCWLSFPPCRGLIYPACCQIQSSRFQLGQGKTPARIVSALAASLGAGKNPSENRFWPGREPRSREKPQREPSWLPENIQRSPPMGNLAQNVAKLAKQSRTTFRTLVPMSRGGDRYPSHSPNFAIMLRWCWQLSQS